MDLFQQLGTGLCQLNSDFSIRVHHSDRFEFSQKMAIFNPKICEPMIKLYVMHTCPDCDPLPKTGKPELVRGNWEMNDGILQHKACEQAPLAICNSTIRLKHHNKV